MPFRIEDPEGYDPRYRPISKPKQLAREAKGRLLELKRTHIPKITIVDTVRLDDTTWFLLITSSRELTAEEEVRIYEVAGPIDLGFKVWAESNPGPKGFFRKMLTRLRPKTA